MSTVYTKKQEENYSSLANKVEAAAAEGRHADSRSVINTISGRKLSQKHGIPAKSPQERLEQWREHFQQLLTTADAEQKTPNTPNLSLIHI